MMEKRIKFAEYVAHTGDRTPDGLRDAAMHAGYESTSCRKVGASLIKNHEVLEHIERCETLAGKPPTSSTPPLPGQVRPGREILIIPAFNGDPMAFLEALMDNPLVDLAKRMDAAKTLMPFKYGKLADQGKKKAAQKAAEGVANGKYGPQTAPTPLKAVVNAR